MKTLINIIILALTANLIYGQNSSFTKIKSGITAWDSMWMYKNNRLYFLGGNVGIGTDSPSTFLEIDGNNTDADGNITNGMVTLKNNNYSRIIAEAYSTPILETDRL